METSGCDGRRCPELTLHVQCNTVKRINQVFRDDVKKYCKSDGEEGCSRNGARAALQARLSINMSCAAVRGRVPEKEERSKSG